MQYALITGASGGIGLEFAVQLAAKGHNLILTARNLTKLQILAQDLAEKYGVQAQAIQADLSQAGAATKLYEEAKKCGEVHILINNAGAGVFGKAVELDPAAVNAMIQLNITSLTELATLAAKDMLSRGAGYILNVSSVAGNWPEPFFASYAATKSYVTSFSVALASELKGSGVSVSALLPGFVRTAFDDNANIASEAYKKFSSSLALGPSDVAKIGLSRMFKRKVIGIAGFGNKLASFFNGLLPRTAQAALVRNSIGGLLKKGN